MNKNVSWSFMSVSLPQKPLPTFLESETKKWKDLSDWFFNNLFHISVSNVCKSKRYMLSKQKGFYNVLRYQLKIFSLFRILIFPLLLFQMVSSDLSCNSVSAADPSKWKWTPKFNLDNSYCCLMYLSCNSAANTSTLNNIQWFDLKKKIFLWCISHVTD